MKYDFQREVRDAEFLTVGELEGEVEWPSGLEQPQPFTLNVEYPIAAATESVAAFGELFEDDEKQQLDEETLN